MVTLRYKKTHSGKFSVYLDIYFRDTGGKAVRKYEFLRIYVSRNYSNAKRIAGKDKEKIALARSIRSKKELELSGTLSGLNGRAKRVNLSIMDYIWQDYEKTGRNNSKALHNHLEKFNKGKDILFSDITMSGIEKFKAHLLKNVSHNSMVYYLGVLKKYMNKAYKEELISYNPFRTFKLPATLEYERTYLELHEVQELANTPIRFEPHIRDAFLFSCFTGLRFSDVKKLTYTRFIEEQDKDGNTYNSLQLHPVKTTRTSGKLLKAPLSKQAEKILQSLKRKKDTDLVFYDLPEKNVTNSWLKKWATDAGIEKNLHFHVGRHTFATLSLTAGIDIYTVSKLLGHTRIDATQIYAKIIEEKKQKEVKKFPSFTLNTKRATNDKIEI